jgi:hypothetical protein
MAERSSVFFERISLIYCTQIPGIFHPPFFRGASPPVFRIRPEKRTPFPLAFPLPFRLPFPGWQKKAAPAAEDEGEKKPPFSQKRQAPAGISGKRPFKKESARSRFPLC